MSTILSHEEKPHGYSYLVSATAAFEAAGLSFPSTFDYFFDRGWVIKEPNAFLMFMEAPNRPDAWLVYWAESHTGQNPVRTLLRYMPHYRPYIAWCRPFKGRKEPKYYSTDRLLGYIRETPPAR